MPEVEVVATIIETALPGGGFMHVQEGKVACGIGSDEHVKFISSDGKETIMTYAEFQDKL